MRLCVLLCLLVLAALPVAAFPTVGGGTSTSGSANLEYLPLRHFGDGIGMKIGAPVYVPRLTSMPTYAPTAAREFSIITAYGHASWGNIHPAQAVYDFDDMDTLETFTDNHSTDFHASTLATRTSDLPAWLTGGGFNAAQVSAILQDHVTTVVNRYTGKIDAWSIANETLKSNGVQKSAVGEDFFAFHLGTGYFDDVSDWALAQDAAVKLYINDYNVSGPIGHNKSDGMYNMIYAMKVTRSKTIHGVGMQMHWGLAGAGGLEMPTKAELLANFARYDAIGVDVYITEFDVKLSNPTDADELEEQADIYRTAMEACREASNCVSFVSWCFTDDFTWLTGFSPCMYDANMKPKKAYYGVRGALQ